MPVIKLAIILILLLLAFQDLKSRLVCAYFFPLLIVLFILLDLMQNKTLSSTITRTAYPLGFLLLQLILLTLYFSARIRNWVNITDHFLGWGDILLLISLSFYLSLLNFVLFYLVSALIVLLSWVLWMRITKAVNRRVPLAGLQALFFTFIFVSSWCYPGLNLQDDNWLINLTGW